MRLELAHYHIDNLRFGGKTKMEDGLLSINRDKLKSLLSNDKNFSNIEIEITHPGEMTRIINVLDIIDPRKKVGEGSEVFPGWVGGMGLFGIGRTNVMRNVSVVETGHMEGFFGGIIDMGGVGSQYSPYAKTHNVVLVPTDASGISLIHYVKSLKIAVLAEIIRDSVENVYTILAAN